MKVILGVGNPGKRYEWTRHSAGHLAVDAIVKKSGQALRPQKGKGPFEFVKLEIGGATVALVKSAVFMNESGLAVAKALLQFETKPADCLIVLDDINLPVGKVRFRLSGSSGGHHGLDSIILALGTEEFPRLRVGIGGSGLTGTELSEYVLAELSPADRAALTPGIERAAEAAFQWVCAEAESVMQKFN